MEKANRKKEKWMLYGAYGYTGKLIVEEALKNGHHPVLAGRDPEKLKIISEDFGLPHRTFSLEEPNEIKKNLAGIDLVLNAAGPFKYTAEPLIKACLENKTHYLDITGEISVFERNYHYSEQAQDKKVAIISGVGFDIVPSDCLIKYASNQIEQPNNLELGILALSSYSPGTLKTMVDTIHKGSYIRKDGKLLRIKYGNKCKKIKFSKGTKTLCAVPWGDLSTAFHSSRIPNIKCYLPLPKKIRRLLSNFGKLIQKLFSWNIV